ncbi:hypothetical protein [Salinibacterium sp. ZJ77]|uniref:hypothetical protein n=1 Tax=Salinibacterium sp. ZJ77 TaxID=2708337 RepID=UPI0014235AEA|nr:hypothetical protein [Salinibacterium sp. ZJ77]
MTTTTPDELGSAPAAAPASIPTMAAPSPAGILVAPPSAMREMHAPHVRPPIAPDARTTTLWVWMIVTVPWVLSSTIFLFDIDAVIDALWVGDDASALAHIVLHLGIITASSLTTIALALLFAHRDARHLRSIGVVRPFPWGFAALAGLVYLIGRTVALRTVARPSAAPLVVSAALYLAYYAIFGIWASVTVAAALQAISSTL